MGEKGSAGCPGLLPRGEGKGSAALAPSQELVTNPVTRHTVVVFAGRNLLCLGGSFPEGWHLSPPLWMRRVPSPDTAFPLTGAHPSPPALPGASSGSGAEIHLPGGTCRGPGPAGPGSHWHSAAACSRSKCSGAAAAASSGAGALIASLCFHKSARGAWRREGGMVMAQRGDEHSAVTGVGCWGPPCPWSGVQGPA